MLGHALPSRRRSAGFTLVELMISIVIGLIVIGAVIAFTVSTVRAYGDNIGSTRLTQDLRTSMNVIIRELRRAGFDSSSVSRVLTASNPSNFNALTVNGDCVVYEYDRGIDGAGGTPDASERRAVRLDATRGVLQLNTADASASCGGSDWIDISDPRVVEITEFAPELYETTFCSDLGSTPGVAGAPATYQVATGSVRSLGICIEGRLRSDADVIRRIGNVVRIRAENLQFNDTSGSACPASTEAPLPTESEFNTDCDSL